MSDNTCETCDRPRASAYQWSEEYSKLHGDGNGCECEDCCAVCWGGCVMTPMAKEKRRKEVADALATANARIATLESQVTTLTKALEAARRKLPGCLINGRGGNYLTCDSWPHLPRCAACKDLDALDLALAAVREPAKGTK